MKNRTKISAFLAVLTTLSCFLVSCRERQASPTDPDDVSAVHSISLTAIAATGSTTAEDFANIESYRVLSSQLTDDFGRTINTYKPLWYYCTVINNATSDNYFSGNLCANVAVPTSVTKENYKTVKLVYRSTSTEVPTLTNGTKIVSARDNASVAANEWNTLYYDYTELSASDSFIINFTEGTDPNDYESDIWEIGYLGLLEDITAAQAHTSAFEGEFKVADVLLDGKSIGKVTECKKSLDKAQNVPKLTVRATGDTSKVTITNGVIDGEGKAISKVTNDGTDIVTVNFKGGDATFRVTDILVDGKSIGNFDKDTISYTFDIGSDAAQPVVSYAYAGAAKELAVATSTEKDRNNLVSKYIVTIADGDTVLYILTFNVDTTLDSSLVNTLYRLSVDKELNVSYFGGSVTNGHYRTYLSAWLDENYGKRSQIGATINHINSSIGGAGSMFGVYRLKEHVVEYMESQITSQTAKSKKPDLVFIEFAINDSSGYDPVYTADGQKLVIAGSDQNYVNIESMVRQLYAVNPKVDIIFVITGDRSNLSGEMYSDVPLFGQAYTDIAKHYDIPIIYVGRQLVRDKFYKNGFSIYPSTAQSDAWLEFFKDMVHPNETGGQIYANTIIEYLAEELPPTYIPAIGDYADKTLPATVYCTANNKGELIIDADLVDIENVDSTKLGGYTVGSAANRGLDYVLNSSTAGDVFSFETDASNIWLWLHAKSTETELVWSIDGGEPKSWKFKLGSPNNYALQLADGLDNTKTHTIRLYHSDANPVEIRSIMLSGLPEGGTATITPVP